MTSQPASLAAWTAKERNFLLSDSRRALPEKARLARGGFDGRRDDRGRSGAGRRRSSALELVDPLRAQAQLLAHLGQLVLQLARLDRETLQELVDLVDVVAADADLEGHRVNGVEGRRRVVRVIHAATIPLRRRARRFSRVR